MGMTRAQVLKNLIKIGGYNTDTFTKAASGLNTSNAKTADVLAYCAKGLGFNARYQAVLADWIKSMATVATPCPEPTPVPVEAPKPDPVPTPAPAVGDGESPRVSWRLGYVDPISVRTGISG